MKKKTKRMLSLLLTGILMLGLLASCGNGQETQNSEPGSQEPDAPVSVGTKELTIGMSAGWDTLTPFRNMTAHSLMFSRMLYDSLGFRAADGSIIPVVAKEWSGEDDGLTWNIEIYDYVEDSAGNHITADDVVWMIGQLKEKALKPIFNRVASVEKTGDYTLKVVLNADIAGTIESILQHTFVVSKAAFDASKDEFITEVVSTSPYQVTEFVSGASMTLEKRDSYWQKPELIDPSMACNLEKVTFRYISETSQQQIALQTGEVDVFSAIDSSLVPAFEGDNQVVVAPSTYILGNQLFFSGHESSPVANDVNLRMAIAYAIDEKAIIDGVYDGLAEPMYDSGPSTLMGYQTEWKQEEYFPFNVDKAKEYLAKSNYKGEELEIMASNSTRNNRMLTMIQAYLLDVGINLKLKLVDRSLYSSSLTDGSTYDIVQVSAGGADYPSFWANRFDNTSYPNGDATSRNDETLTKMVKEASTTAGFTPENINAIHKYVNENAYAYAICQPMIVDMYSISIGLTEPSPFFAGGIDFIASTY